MFSHLINRKIEHTSAKVFEGIARGRKNALDNWFKDTWTALEFIRDSLLTYFSENEIDHKELIALLEEKRSQFQDFSELFIINQDGYINISTSELNRGKNMSHLPNFKYGMEDKPLMHGPYIDEDTIKIGNFNSKFSDEVTLMFSMPYYNKLNGTRAVLCGRIPNDVMCDIIQDEDTHVYKESGDNYLFMIKSNREIAPGTAISRSRFEDNTFTLGDNLKQGVRTKKWGTIQITKHTEFEIVFNDPATNLLHIGVSNTIKNGNNLNTWPGYPDYRHIMVGGKGVVIEPPNCEEVWGMMCEGDISEIYNFKSLQLQLPIVSGITSGVLIFGNYILSLFYDSYSLPRLLLVWILITGLLCLSIRRLVIKPLNRTISILQDIAEGDGDLTLRVKKQSNDEIGELSRWFNKFINNQQSVIKRMGRASKDSKGSAHSLLTLAINVKENTETIETSVSDILLASQKQNTVFQKTQEKLNFISSSISDMNDLISNVSSKVIETNDYAVLSSESSKQVISTMDELESDMKTALESISILKKYSDEISQVTNVISDISTQTNLLSLNASIESARAGEAGKGFSVVAGEVSKLASESSEAAVSISKLISSVQEETENTISRVHNIANKLDKENLVINESMNAFNKIQSYVTEVTKDVQSITNLIGKQSDEINQITASSQEIAAKIDEATLKNTNKSEQAINLVRSISRQTEKVEQASKVLSNSSENLSSIVTAFKI